MTIFISTLRVLAILAMPPQEAEPTWPTLPHNAIPYTCCIFALDGNNVWVGGDFSDPAFTLRSMIYGSRDGGLSWQRLGPAVPNSTIFSIYFLDSKTGWAAGAWTTESAGSPFVLRTTDGGVTWDRSDVRITVRPTSLFVPVSIEFLTPKHGMLCAVSCIVEEEQAMFFTQDGGKTWAFSHGRHDESGHCNDLSVTKNGLLWKLSPNDKIFLSRDNGQTWKRTRTQPIVKPQDKDVNAMAKP